MSLRGIRYRKINLCQTTSSSESGNVDAPMPSEHFPRSIHSPNFPRPPILPLDANGLRERATFATKCRTQYRKVSPRLLNLINVFGEKCTQLVKGKPTAKNRKRELKEIEAMGGELQSRWEYTEGPDGLIQGVMDAISCMTEQRLLGEYGDYLAVSLDKFKTNDFQDTYWKPHHLTWTEVGEKLEEEEEDMRRSAKRVGTIIEMIEPSGPITRDISKAAKILKIDASQISFEIKEYTKRNQQSHNGLRGLIDAAAWPELAAQIIKDKEKLQEIWQADPHGKRQMMNCIEAVQKEWFKDCFHSGRFVRFELTDKAQKKADRIMARERQEKKDRERNSRAATADNSSNSASQISVGSSSSANQVPQRLP
ncbi:MAG: hypothetical protein Q9222_006683 [Ikaeria aurantiellina]